MSRFSLHLSFSTLFLLVLPRPCLAVDIVGGDSGQLGQVRMIHPPSIPYALVDVLAGRPHPGALGVVKITSSGKILLAAEPGHLDEENPASVVAGYVWDRGELTAIRTPAWPWTHGIVPNLTLSFEVADMNDSGSIVGTLFAWGDYAPDGDPIVTYGRESLPVLWPSDQPAQPRVLELGLPPVSTRWGQHYFVDCYRTRIDDAGACYAEALVRRLHSDYSVNWTYYHDVIKWTDTGAQPENLTDNVAFTTGDENYYGYDSETPFFSRIWSAPSSSGALLVEHRRDFVRSFEAVLHDPPSRFEVPPPIGSSLVAVLDDGRVVDGSDHTVLRAQDGTTQTLTGSYISNTGDGDVVTRSYSARLLWKAALADDGNPTYTAQAMKGPVIDKINWNDHGTTLGPDGMLAYSVTMDATLAGTPLSGVERHRVLVGVPASLTVDHDGDRQLDSADVGATSPGYPFWHAINVDDDADTTDAASITATTGPDWQNSRVDGKDDLSDFFPLFLDIKQLLGVLPPTASGLTYKLKQADGAVNVVFTRLTRETAFDYLDAATATTGYGPDFGQAAASATTRQVTASGLALPADFLTRIRDEGQGVVLVEMRGLSSAPLRLVVENADGVEVAELALGLASFRFRADAGKVHLGFDPPNKAEGDPANEYWASVVQGATNNILNLDTPPGAMGGLQWRVAPADTARVGIAMSYVDGTTAKATITGHNTGATTPELAKIGLVPFGRGGPAVLTLNVMVLPQREMKLAIYTVEDPDSPLTQFASAPAVTVPSDDEILAVCNDSFKQAGVRLVLHPERGDRARPFRYDTWGLAEFLTVYRYDGLLPARSPDGLLTENEKSGLIGTHADAPPPALGSLLPAATAASDTIRIILFKDSGLPYDSENFSGPKKRALSSNGAVFLFARNLDPNVAVAAAHEVGHILDAHDTGDGHDNPTCIPPFPSAVMTDLPYNALPTPPSDTRYAASPRPAVALMQGGWPTGGGLPWPYGRWMRRENWNDANNTAKSLNP